MHTYLTFTIENTIIDMPGHINKVLGNTNKTTNDNICCLFYTFIEYISILKDKNKHSEVNKAYKHLNKYWERIKLIFFDETIDKTKLSVKVQNLSLSKFFYYFVVYSEDLNFELKKSFVKLFKKAVSLYDVNHDSYVINN